ncbi:hypothetical protein IW262DRAFT_1293496 [Armillaria fumosa]|nr:hypothetical protein IW262DRAFT_1293496 [Armillaria fumosa]
MDSPGFGIPETATRSRRKRVFYTCTLSQTSLARTVAPRFIDLVETYDRDKSTLALFQQRNPDNGMHSESTALKKLAKEVQSRQSRGKRWTAQSGSYQVGSDEIGNTACLNQSDPFLNPTLKALSGLQARLARCRLVLYATTFQESLACKGRRTMGSWRDASDTISPGNREKNNKKKATRVGCLKYSRLVQSQSRNPANA